MGKIAYHSMPAAEAVEIRSYRTVFDLERRIYRIDRLRLNPGGLPVRGVLYFVALVLLATLLSSLPLVGAGMRLLPWYVRAIAAPAGLAGLLSIIRVEGRPFHVAAHALARHACGPRYLSGLRACPRPGRRWVPPEILMLPDGSGPRFARLRFTGPGVVLVRNEHERTERSAHTLGRLLGRDDLTLRELGQGERLARAQMIELARGGRLAVRPSRGR